ncbi:uncharacterized protein LOC110901221 [Helianthus annuus]|uniref:uncharacterized protein LOC110901221 n=1 Tax=Helianthus annuus TaxID=4232 RepID=UPI001652E79A|nr:uncharacterized protein LOC110901221 [Helianthus annuus]
MEDADVTITLASVKQVQDRFANVLFGYFLGKRLAFPFKLKEGMDQVLQDGPWLIRNIPLFLKQWTPNTELKKEELKKIPVWVKLHDVPLAAYTEDGLSLIASKIGCLKVLDIETTKMCLDSWSRSGYARAIVELDADKELKEMITMAIPNMEEGGFLKSEVRVEYEWKPPKCNPCNGFRSGINRRKGMKQHFHVNEKTKFVYRPKKQAEKLNSNTPSSSKGPQFATSNQFSVLNEVAEEPDDEVLEVKLSSDDGMPKFMGENFNDDTVKTGASTPVEGVLAILESHVKVQNLSKICRNVFRNWDWSSNGNVCIKGTRIILGWNMDHVDVMVLHVTDQVIHTQILFKKEKTMLYVSFVYASNSDQDRKQLWNALRMHKRIAMDKPWAIMGDFNVALNLDDKSMGSSVVTSAIKDFNKCVNCIEVMDVKVHGMHFTWNQRPRNGVGIRKKLDRIMANVNFIDSFMDAYASFLPNGISDHCPCVLKLMKTSRNKPKPFKFSNLLAHKKEFMAVVKTGWEMTVEGVPMFRLVKKLRGLKHLFRSLLHKQGNLHRKVLDLKEELDKLQTKLDLDPFNVSTKEAESMCVKKYQDALIDEERFLKQKSKQKWLEVGDANTAFFHSAVKCRNHINKIHIIKDTFGNLHEGDGVALALVNHFQGSFGTKGGLGKRVDNDIFSNKLQSHVAESMSRPVTQDEVKNAIFLLMRTRRLVRMGRMLQEITHTFIALIPKVPTLGVVTDYRPISCCNVVYKGISKIITSRILEGLKEIVSDNQPAFVPCRRISDNIMLTQELMHNYHRQVGPPRCAMKVDIKKAIGGDINSVKLILKSLKEFKDVSGLVPSNAKSTIFLCNVPNHVKERIIELIPFEEGKLPIKYLGVPLLASRLLVKDCQVLVDQMNKRIMDWKNCFLSFAGRLQLVISVLSSIHVYWASVFILPAKIIKELESIMKWFLWGFGTASKGRAKVAWKEVYLPKAEGGLGIRRITDVNKSLMAYHIFSILSGRKSLWTDWVDLYRLKGRSIWDIPVHECSLRMEEIIKM